MKKTAEQIANTVLTKIAISEELAQRVFQQAIVKATPKGSSMESLVAAGKFPKWLTDILSRSHRTNLRSQGISRQDMPEALEDLKGQLDMFKSLG